MTSLREMYNAIFVIGMILFSYTILFMVKGLKYGKICLVLVFLMATIYYNTDSVLNRREYVQTRRRPSAAIVYLADLSKPTRVNELENSLQALHSNFLVYHKYPVYIFSDMKPPFLVMQRFKMASRHHASFHLVENFHDMANFTDSNITQLGYKLMCRFWAYSFFQQPVIQNLTYYWRLDTDLTLIQPVRIDPFTYMEAKKLHYLYGATSIEAEYVVVGLWDHVVDFATTRGVMPYNTALLSNMNQVTSTLFGPSLDHESSLKTIEQIASLSISGAGEELKRQGFNHYMFYNNFEISRLDIWQSELYRDFMSTVDANGGIFRIRWGDSPIRTMMLAVIYDFSMPNSVSAQVGGPRVEQLKGVMYTHAGFHWT